MLCDELFYPFKGTSLDKKGILGILSELGKHR